MIRVAVAILIIVVAVAAFRIVQAELRTNLELNSQVAAVFDLLDGIRLNLIENIKHVGVGITSPFRKAPAGGSAADTGSAEAITIHLRHGGVVSGKLLAKDAETYTVDWKGQPFVISQSQIASIELKTQKDVEWPYTSDVVAVRTNGIVLDGTITAVGPDTVTFSFPEGGGSMEMELKRSDIDYLLFAPVYNPSGEEIEKHIRSIFPKMKVYRDGNVTIFSDSHEMTIKSYKKTLRAAYTEIYLTFFSLFKSRKPQQQNYIVAFDDFKDYVEFAATDGVPGWIAIGYFDPLQKTLYMFNAFGERMEKMVFDVIVGKSGKTFDQIVGAIKSRVDSRYHVFIDGQAKEISDKFWDTYSLYKNELTDMTISTLRHEFAHEVFHNWGLQTVVLTRPNVDKKKLAAKKKEFLDTKDYRKKEELLMGLMKMQRQEAEGLEMDAAQSWLAEGIATYAATEPVGSVDEEMLFTYQEAARKQKLNPIEFTTSFRMGSFQGLATEAVISSYAESWAFTTFLMARYPDRFMSYQDRMVTMKPKDNEEEFGWLLEATGKDLPTLEKEFRAYMAAYPQAEDPFVKNYMRYYKIWEDFLKSN